ncbi:MULTISPECIES: hypothetical protein [Acinetobacter]|jgi:type VI secretion system secreted protein VgrG|uniref:Uncharacterized protein n=1 Tax=Acinetobacter bereziniae TaxID=106648 RepID=A0A8I1A7Y6_ACIBZ|nr:MULTISPECIES: hypothetical protein [Acinetobacter]MEC8122447.1 hypothetical protein [Pseudomonadota bacterium]ATZ65631.1 hypothetical protein BSR55_21010 [Acinetobacter bereziniae]MBJ8453274.1 hypothetical protein [Acinetobacter bereziniae]MBJ8457360.1 hypothetical protein [Acinetobacter bereziniae]MBJ9372517.1 hypothetical protein [Acinetobacter sp. TGL-Y2]
MAGGSQIIINKNGITIITPAKFEVKAGQHLFKDGAKVETKLPFLPKGTAYNLRYLFTDDNGIPYKNKPYTVIYPNGSEIKGITDNDGYSSTFFSSEEENLQIHLELE